MMDGGCVFMFGYSIVKVNFCYSAIGLKTNSLKK